MHPHRPVVCRRWRVRRGLRHGDWHHAGHLAVLTNGCAGAGWFPTLDSNCQVLSCQTSDILMWDDKKLNDP
jgi:hypothetical protein